MNPAIQYLNRNDLIKSWFDVPCSICLENKSNSIIVTITKNKNPNLFVVKTWFLHNCHKEYILPPFEESVINRNDLFSHPSIVIEGYKPFYKNTQEISSRSNGMFGPMPEELYSFLFQNVINGEVHKKCRQIWLWNKFIKIYLPTLLNLQSYVNEYNCEDEFVITNQMKIVENHFQKIWNSWQKWTNYFLSPTPGEIIFGKEYGTL